MAKPLWARECNLAYFTVEAEINEMDNLGITFLVILMMIGGFVWERTATKQNKKLRQAQDEAERLANELDNRR